MDDGIITLFMNMINNRSWILMPPINKLKKWDLTIIRPLSFVREKYIDYLVKKENIPFLSWTCPIWVDSRRKDIWILMKLIEEKEPWSIENMYFAAVKEFIKCYKDKNWIID
jgi:tRNA(Ile)-lysidine synthase TilS/MesJ